MMALSVFESNTELFMKKILIVTTALLLLWGCSKKDDDDDGKIFQTEVQSIEAATITPIVPPKMANEESSEPRLSEEELKVIRDKFVALEENADREIELKFFKDSDRMSASIGMRCETTEVDKLKACLRIIEKSLMNFMNKAGDILGESEDPSLKEEFAKFNLSAKWLSKIKKSIRMVR